MWLSVALGIYAMGMCFAVFGNGAVQPAVTQPSGNTSGNQPNTVNPSGGGTPGSTSGGSVNGGTNPSGGNSQLTSQASSIEHGISHSTLTATQQDTYDQLLEHLTAREESFDVVNTDQNALDRAYEAVHHDHPELFWLEGYSYSMSPSSTTITVSPTFSCTQQEIDTLTAEIEAASNAALSTIPDQGTTYEKVRAIYEWVVLQTDYQNGPNDQSIRGVFLDGSAVCAGYSRAFQYLCHRLDIPCGYVSGTVNGRGNHAWCLVDIDGTNTYVDVTWGDPAFEDPSRDTLSNITYDYLCVTTDELYRDRTALSPVSGLPVCDSTEYDFYRLQGTYVDKPGDEAVRECVGQAASSGDVSVAIKLASQEEYEDAVAFIENDLFSKGVLPVSATSISYRTNETLYIIEISWE